MDGLVESAAKSWATTADIIVRREAGQAMISAYNLRAPSQNFRLTSFLFSFPTCMCAKLCEPV